MGSLLIPGDRYDPNAEGYDVVARTALEEMRDEGWLPQAE